MKEFKILDAVKNSDGNYDITYTLQTYLEGRGLVVVEFRCLDENGSEVDRFGGAFQGTDYTWSAQEAKTTISFISSGISSATPFPIIFVTF